MDGPNIDHSDSDSGESWTLLEDVPAFADDALEYCKGLPKHKGDTADNIDKDEDTDGISVITDSEPELMPSDIVDETAPPKQEDRPAEHLPQFIPVKSYPDNSNDEHNESVRSTDDLLGDGSVKLKTYVHRRNKRLSTVLNIIVLGSVITAAGVAIGHMWGVRDDCTYTAPSVNKILSNLYKLQEENAYLRNKLKEFTLLNNIKLQKPPNEKSGVKQPRCKKMFEAPLNSENVNKLTKCLDDENNEKKLLENHTIQPEYEKDYLSDVDKLKNVYMQNRSWLDEAIARRLKNEKQQAFKDKRSITSALKQVNLNKEQKKEKNEEGFNINIIPHIIEEDSNVADDTKSTPTKKITYADSLRSDNKDNKTKQTTERDNLEVTEIRKDYRKKRSKRSADSPVDSSFSEEEFKKDDRYMAPRPQQDRKKRDRHHLNKKQKRRNKYEQLDIKNDYLNDDEFSVTSSQENDFILKNPDKNDLSRDFERNTYIDQFAEAKENMKATQTVDKARKEKPSKKDKVYKRKEDASWYEKRALQRMEARKKLEHQLFGESTPNDSGWYFKRMQKREQCRIKRDNSNSTNRKLLKRNMNYKLKR